MHWSAIVHNIFPKALHAGWEILADAILKYFLNFSRKYALHFMQIVSFKIFHNVVCLFLEKKK